MPRFGVHFMGHRRRRSLFSFFLFFFQKMTRIWVSLELIIPDLGVG
jgi:hypothetical protein